MNLDLRRLCVGWEAVRIEDRLYLHLVTRRAPLLESPLQVRDLEAEMNRLGQQAMTEQLPGRFRRLGFTCDCLGAAGRPCRRRLLEVFDEIRKEVAGGACEPSQRFIDDHVTPSSLQGRPALIGAYNAALVVRVARYVLDEPALARIRLWCRQMLAHATVPGSSGNPAALWAPGSNSPVFARWQGVGGGSMGDEQISPDESEELSAWVRTRRRQKLSARVREIVEGLQQSAPNVFVDEIEGRVALSGSDETDILTWRNNAGGMLWLAMCHAGGVLTHDAVRRFFGFARSQRVSHLRSTLRNRVGSLAEIILPPANRSSRAWRIPDRGWTYVWLRPHPADGSLLNIRRATR